MTTASCDLFLARLVRNVLNQLFNFAIEETAKFVQIVRDGTVALLVDEFRERDAIDSGGFGYLN